MADIWETAKGQLQLQMTQATFDSWIKSTNLVEQTNGHLIVATDSSFAKEWLENRLSVTINRTIANLLKRPVEIRFIVRQPEPPAASVELPPAAPAPQTADLAGRLAAADYYAAFFKAGGSGYSMLPHYHLQYWMPYLGDAFDLWKRLESEDRTPLSPPYWTPISRQYYTRLAHLLNRPHPRYVSGGVVECWQSIRQRQEGGPVECCHNPDYAPVKEHRGRCVHWHTGLLEIMHGEGLVIIHEKNADHPRAHLLELQTWRMLPLLTPRQVAGLHQDLQMSHARWLADFGHLVGLESLSDWERITAKSLVELMPNYDSHELENNYAPRRKFEAI